MHVVRVDVLSHLPDLQDVILRDVGMQVDISETRTLKGMYFQLVESQVLSTQGQPDGGVNLHRLTATDATTQSSLGFHEKSLILL